MASPSPANETGGQCSEPRNGLSDPHGDHEELPSAPGEPTAAPTPVDVTDTNSILEPSKPKSEEPPPNFFDVPEETTTMDFATGTNESAVSDLSRNQIPHIAELSPRVETGAGVGASVDTIASAADTHPIASRTIVLKKKLFKTPNERTLEAENNRRRLEKAGDLFRQSLIIKSPTPVAPQSTVPARPTNSHDHEDLQVVEAGRRSSPIELDTEAEDVAAVARFKGLKRSYERKKKKGQNVVEDDIAFSKARNAEDHRLKLKSRKRAYEDVDSEPEPIVDDEDSLFVAEENTSAPRDAHTHEDPGVVVAPKRRKPCRPNKIPESALQDATQIGFAVLEAEGRRAASKKRQPKGQANKTDQKQPKTRVSKSKDKKKGDGIPKPKREKARKGPEMLNYDTLFGHNIVSAAQANAGQAAQPGFTSTKKAVALAELIASIPEGERNTHNADKNALDKATRSFTGHAAMKADGNNGWRLRGMKTSLYHYQLLGAAFMRDRENSSTRPYGGLQSDEMGLGKTVTCLANIVDGQASPNSPNRTTLIVCPAGLCSQWLSEIKKHVQDETFQDTMVYRAGGRVESTNPAKTLSNVDIIITSYNEVARSYPSCKAPMHLVTPQTKAAWWAQHFNDKRGVLHQIFFRRIVLDEAQAIKNHSSKTSVAVRSLSGKYRWAISGTPIQNSLDEFFPFFAFLKVPNTGSLETFKSNFTGRNKTSDLRLQTFLRQIMIRRTHLDKIFGRPLLQLPGITTKTVKVEFNDCERAIYRIVKNRFVEKIRTYARSGDLDKKYQSIFVLYLRLRQLVSHILLIQQTLKELLEGEDLEKLWRLTEPEVQPQGEAGSQAVLSQLRKMLSQVQDDKTAPGNEATQDDPAAFLNNNTEGTDVTNDVGGSFGLAFKFRKYLRSLRETGKWEYINKRTLCHKCSGVPDHPHVTSCLHVYCKECLEDMLFRAGQTGGDKARCLACDAAFEHCEPCRGFDQAGNTLNAYTNSTPDRRTRKSADSEEADIDWLSVGGSILPSAKTLAVKAQIQNWVEEDPDAKIIIFTQFRQMIRILSRMMQEETWGWSQFHGAMSFAARDKAILDFAENKEKKVLLASLKAGGVGLNLTMASKVIIIDLWWNESVEQQAFCRCFRIGQDRPVDICRIVVKDSIDDDILAMQERKTSEIDMAMAAKNQPGKLSTAELLRLFGPINWDAEDDHDAVTGSFIFVEDENDDDDQSDSGPPSRVPAPPFE